MITLYVASSVADRIMDENTAAETAASDNIPVDDPIVAAWQRLADELASLRQKAA